MAELTDTDIKNTQNKIKVLFKANRMMYLRCKNYFPYLIIDKEKSVQFIPSEPCLHVNEMTIGELFTCYTELQKQQVELYKFLEQVRNMCSRSLAGETLEWT